MQITRSMLARSSVLVIGDAMLDQYWFGDVDRISPEAPVPIVRVLREEFRLGGAANVALNAHSLDAKAQLLSITGDDEASTKLREMLSDAGISPLLQVDPEMKTTLKLRVSGRSQQLLRVDFEERPKADSLAVMLSAYRDAMMDARAAIFSDYGKGALAHVAPMISFARDQGKPALVDPKGDDFSRYAGATVITPNRAEFARVVGQWDDESGLEERAQNLRRALNLGALLVTRSEEGMSLFDAEGHFRVHADTREVFDVTGAGDTVIATLGALLAIDVPMRDAVTIANRAASIVVGKFGTATVAYEELFG